MTSRQRGATSVEFALVLLMFLVFFLGLLDVSRMLYTWNAANEATRAGARYAVVCHDSLMGPSTVLSQMQGMVPEIQTISLQWEPSGCNSSSCEGVTVSITGLQYQWITPLLGPALGAIPMPQFATYLPREIMRQDPNSSSIC